MTKKELLDLLVSWENLELIINEVISHPEYLKLLIEIALHIPAISDTQSR